MRSFFLSRVFGREKDGRGGKFEAPDTTGRTIDEEKEFRPPSFRPKSYPWSPGVKPKRLSDSLRPLSLDFDDLRDNNGYIFEESNSEAIFSDAVLGQRWLDPMEALVLIRACSKSIISRGLETLGVMTPHWYSANPDIQRRLISKFLRFLDSTSSIAAATNFEDELNVTRSIHDVAAVLRWGLRHVQLVGDSFGTNDGWYKAFLDAEVANNYPPKAFSEKLAPSLPTSHLDLLISTLEIFSSFAAFSDSNSTSGSKLSKMFGLWLLTARQVEDKDDWRSFYARWERTGRMLEHLFLARIRDQSTDQRIPTRLLELVGKYPYTYGLSSPRTDFELLPYPQFTTALHSALFVRVQYEVASHEHIPKTKIHPSVLLADAFSTKVEEGEFVELWAKITNGTYKTGSGPLGHVFADESLRLLSLVADKSKEKVKSPTSTIGTDWEQSSASGFLDTDQTFLSLASTLFDTDIEKAEHCDIPLFSRKSSKRAGRKSLELPRSVVIAESTGDSSPEAINLKSPSKARQEATCHLEVIELDEAFVDFWSDALLDPIASDWPTFVVCKFKTPDLTFGPGDRTTKKSLKWLVLEQVYSVKSRPIPSSPITTPSVSTETSPRVALPTAQSPSGKRLSNFWRVFRTPSTGSQKAKKTLKTFKVGGMEELIEEDEDKIIVPGSNKSRSLDLLGDKRSAEKKSDKLEKLKSVDVTGPEILSTAITDVDARASTSSTVVGARAVAAATTAAVELATKQESNIVKEVDLSTAPEVVAETSEPVVVPETADDVPKQELIPVEAKVAVTKAENTTPTFRSRATVKRVRFAYANTYHPPLPHPSLSYSSSIVPSSIGPITPPNAAHSLPGSSRYPARVSFHRYLVPDAILWDLLDCPSMSTRNGRHLSSSGLLEPASEPSLPFIDISFKYLPWTCEVYASNRRDITVSDVLESLYRSFRINVTQLEFETLSEEDRRRATRAYAERYRRHRGRAYEQEKRGGMKRVDFLMGRTRFEGLSADEHQPQKWHLRVTRTTHHDQGKK